MEKIFMPILYINPLYRGEAVYVGETRYYDSAATYPGLTLHHGQVFLVDVHTNPFNGRAIVDIYHSFSDDEVRTWIPYARGEVFNEWKMGLPSPSRRAYVQKAYGTFYQETPEPLPV